jgi:hypothetical protein
MRMDSYLAGLLLIAGCTLVAVLGLVAVRRRIDAKTLAACHEVGGYLLSVVGTLYAVLLGLIVVDAMGLFQEAHTTTEQEANALADIVLLSERMPAPQRARIARLATAYADLVAGPEWAAMDHGRYLPEARRAARALIDAVFAFEPTTQAQSTLHDAQVEAALQLWNNRRLRTQLAARSVPGLKWTVLITGGLITIVFTYFFAVEHLRVQLLMTALVTASIALNLFLVGMFGHPFSGDLRVDPSCYKVVQELAVPLPNDAAPRETSP